VRGDIQKENIDYFDTYAPVISCSTIRILLTLVYNEDWSTCQVEYDNAFAQAELTDTVCVEPQQLFWPKSCKDLVLKLLTSLYGIKQAQWTLHEKTRIDEQGFEQSEVAIIAVLKQEQHKTN